ncbi:MAG: DUF192 domain-containing protein [Sandaracinus sp.]|nr:DUF192 domain-containing protein [Sandaracinus sp.]
MAIMRGADVVLEVHVEVARDEDARREGLRGRDLGDDEGLWMIFPAESEVCLVNDGVDFDVDAVFVVGGRAGSVATLRANEPSPVCHPASEVLEVRGGVATDVRAGDDVRLR